MELMWAQDTASQLMGEETVVLHLQTGRAVKLNATSSRLWARLEHGATVDRLVQMLAEHPGVDEATARSDAAAFTSGMSERGLVEVKPPARPPG